MQEVTKEEKRLNIQLTLMINMLEVMNRFIYTVVDNKALKHVLKQKFKRFLESGRALDAEFRKKIRLDKRFDDPEELFDVDCDHMLNLILATEHLKTDEMWIKAISSVKSIKK